MRENNAICLPAIPHSDRDDNICIFLNGERLKISIFHWDPSRKEHIAHIAVALEDAASLLCDGDRKKYAKIIAALKQGMLRIRAFHDNKLLCGNFYPLAERHGMTIKALIGKSTAVLQRKNDLFKKAFSIKITAASARRSGVLCSGRRKK